MKEHVTVTSKFEAVNGKIFATAQDCLAYEASLPAHLKYCLRQNFTADNLREVATWQIGRGVDGTRTEYECAGFLREGGEYSVATYDYTQLALVFGRLDEAVSYALEKFSFDNLSNLKISKQKIINLSEYFDGKAPQ